VRRVTSPHTIGDVTEALHVSPATGKHSIEGSNYIEVAVRRLSNVGSPTIILRVTGTWSTRTVVLPITSCFFSLNLVTRVLS